MLTTGHVVFCVMNVSVDMLAAVPILCVEQLVSPLLCMNASQSIIIFLWRIILCGEQFLFNFVLFGTFLSLSGRITHNMLCFGVTRTKFMDSLYSCFVAQLSLTDC